MNDDFTELENELKRLRPAQPTSRLRLRIEEAFAEPDEEKIIRPERFRAKWAALGLGLAAAAVFLLFLRVNMERRQSGNQRIAHGTPVPAISPFLGGIDRSTPVNALVPADVTQVVYNRRVEGLQFASDKQQPLRRVRYQTRQTLQWRNPTTGASLRVSYPSEEVVLIPVSGQ